MSIMVATGKGATAGVLFRNAEAIEVLREGRHARGRQDRHADRGQAAAGRGRRVAGLRRGGAAAPGRERSSAPASIRWPRRSSPARRSAASRRRPRRTSSRSPARACAGASTGRRVALGNRALLAELGVDARRCARPRGRRCARDGQTVMFVVVDGKPAGLLGVADPDQGDHRRGDPRAARGGPAHRDAHRRQRDDRARRWRRSSASTRSIAEVLPDQKARSGEAPAGRGAHRGHGRRRHQRRARRWRRPTSASPWAPAPTWRWRAPASRW